eukprot:scaffold38735_cov69-Phaeocystis_antarctica.AAC.3
MLHSPRPRRSQRRRQPHLPRLGGRSSPGHRMLGAAGWRGDGRWQPAACTSGQQRAPSPTARPQVHANPEQPLSKFGVWPLEAEVAPKRLAECIVRSVPKETLVPSRREESENGRFLSVPAREVVAVSHRVHTGAHFELARRHHFHQIACAAPRGREDTAAPIRLMHWQLLELARGLQQATARVVVACLLPIERHVKYARQQD